MKSHLVTGGAGFIGVNIVRALLSRGNRVTVLDDFSRGRPENIAVFADTPAFSFKRVDCSEAANILDALDGEEYSEIWHLAANSDIPAGVADPAIDLRRTFLTTFAALKAAQSLGATAFHFASSSAIYGDHQDRVIHEDIGPLQPISNYGAMKLASEAQIRAAVEAWLPRASIFRFPNVIGVPATHGVIYDFCYKLLANPLQLDVLGDGSQQKAYLHVDDLVSAMLHISSLGERYAVYNVGPDDAGIRVSAIAECVKNEFAPEASISFGTGSRGWVGDVPRFEYSIERLRATGWKASLSSIQAVQRSVSEIGLQILKS